MEKYTNCGRDMLWKIIKDIQQEEQHTAATATTTATATTEKGDPSLLTTNSARVNLFFKLVRDIPQSELFELIDAAWLEDPLDTMRIIFNSRDCRGGKGDRLPFMAAMQHIAEEHPKWVEVNLKHVPTFGRWLDLIELYPVDKDMVAFIISTQLEEDLESPKPSLLAKWFPSEGKHWDRKYPGLRKDICETWLECSTTDLRKKYITPLREKLRIVEKLMCTNKWDEIEYSHVPSVAMNRLNKAFYKHDKERFNNWKADVASGKKKINADQVYPHDIIRHFVDRRGNSDDDGVFELQWKQIVEKYKDYVQDSIAVVDVSGSMSGTPMEVAIALGLLISTVTDNPMITFSESPTLHKIWKHDTLRNQVKEIMDMNWGQNTNFERVCKLLLALPKIPKRLFIFSDMQFDQACPDATTTQFERMKERFARAKVQFPEIIFWNLRGDTIDYPVSSNESGVALLSGYSPALLKNVLLGEEMTPYSIMRHVIDAERYACIQGP